VCGDMVLNEAFPVLFGIARVQDASVVDNMRFRAVLFSGT
jgi:hypothetical protein